MAKYSNSIYFKYSDELKKALLQDDIKFLKVYGDDDICVEYKRVVEEKPFTNADRIRAMTDEELSYWAGVTCPPSSVFWNKECKGEWNSDCHKCWLDWLKQEARVD